MSEPAPELPPRRRRYAGKHPRHFSEKYKEHRPDQFAEDVAKILASGKTPAGTHRPIMVTEILTVLAPQPGETAVDCTLGYGGHARELLAAVQPIGKLIALDADPVELPKTEQRLRAFGLPAESLVVHRSNFAGLLKLLANDAPLGADVLLADLGLSSMQIDNPDRGFTFKSDGPLDMRMNPFRGITAAKLLDQLDANQLATLFIEHADEPLAGPLAKAIIQRQQEKPLTTTGELAEVIEGACRSLKVPDREGALDTTRRVFQALRIAVNDEYGSLDALLRSLPSALKPGGRAAILSFHSGEDRRVKQAFKQGLVAGVYEQISDDVIRATPEERRANPRSVPAKLRWAVRAKP